MSNTGKKYIIQAVENAPIPRNNIPIPDKTNISNIIDKKPIKIRNSTLLKFKNDIFYILIIRIFAILKFSIKRN